MRPRDRRRAVHGRVEPVVLADDRALLARPERQRDLDAGAAMLLVSIVGLWLTRKGRVPKSKLVWKLAMFSIAGPIVGHSAGWIFTEMGRQPWTVVGLYRTEESVSPVGVRRRRC